MVKVWPVKKKPLARDIFFGLQTNCRNNKKTKIILKQNFLIVLLLCFSGNGSEKHGATLA